MPETVAESTKRCPFCGEEILAAAVKCKHCQSVLDSDRVRELTPTPPTDKGSTSNVMAGLASFFVPGLGQLVQARVAAGLFIFLVSGGLWVVGLGWLGHIVAAVDAATYQRNAQRKKVPWWVSALVVLAFGAGLFVTCVVMVRQ